QGGDDGARVRRDGARLGEEGGGHDHGHQQPADHRSNRDRNLVQALAGSSGITRVSPTTVMKLVSPVQRGSTCRWMWSATPAPAGLPRFMPMFIPSGL